MDNDKRLEIDYIFKTPMVKDMSDFVAVDMNNGEYYIDKCRSSNCRGKVVDSELFFSLLSVTTSPIILNDIYTNIDKELEEIGYNKES